MIASIPPEPQGASAAAVVDETTTTHIRRAQGGDVDALNWIVDRFSPLLRVTAQYRLGSRLGSLYEADDLVQETWATVLPRLRGIGEDATRRTPAVVKFLSTTLFNVVMNLVRRHVAGKPKVELGLRFGDAPRYAFLSSAATGAITRAARRESHDRLAEALAFLPPDERALVVLRGIEQRPYRDIAAVVGRPAPTLAVQYRRALAKLRARLPGSLFDGL